MKILAVDDDENQLERLKNILSGSKLSVITGIDGVEGLELFKELTPSLVVTDLVMPNSSGYELIKRIRELDSNVPIIAFSGYLNTNEFELEELIKLGANEAIPKPSNSRMILKSILKHLT